MMKSWAIQAYACNAFQRGIAISIYTLLYEYLRDLFVRFYWWLAISAVRMQHNVGKQVLLCSVWWRWAFETFRQASKAGYMYAGLNWDYWTYEADLQYADDIWLVLIHYYCCPADGRRRIARSPPLVWSLKGYITHIAKQRETFIWPMQLDTSTDISSFRPSI